MPKRKPWLYQYAFFIVSTHILKLWSVGVRSLQAGTYWISEKIRVTSTQKLRKKTYLCSNTGFVSGTSKISTKNASKTLYKIVMDTSAVAALAVGLLSSLTI